MTRTNDQAELRSQRQDRASSPAPRAASAARRALACAGCRRRHARRRAQASATAKAPRCRNRVTRSAARWPSRWTLPTLSLGAQGRRQGQQAFRPHRRPGQQCRHRPRKPRRGRHRGGFRLHGEHQPQGHLLHHPGGGEADDRPEIRAASSTSSSQAGSVTLRGECDLLHEQGRHQPPDALPRGGVERGTASR